jgi:hypothetical protein
MSSRGTRTGSLHRVAAAAEQTEVVGVDEVGRTVVEAEAGRDVGRVGDVEEGEGEEAAVEEEGQGEKVEEGGRVAQENGHGRIRTKRAGGIIIGRGVMIRKWRVRERGCRLCESAIQGLEGRHIWSAWRGFIPVPPTGEASPCAITPRTDVCDGLALSIVGSVSALANCNGLSWRRRRRRSYIILTWSECWNSQFAVD